MKALSDPKWVSKTPIATVFLLENANVQQLWRMWHEHTAKGQSLWGWLMVGAALLLWCNFYRVMLPKEKLTLWATMFGVVMNTAVWLSVLYFRYGVHS